MVAVRVEGHKFYICRSTPEHMQDIFFSIGRFLEATFEVLLVPFAGLPVAAIFVLMFVGLFYWLYLQGKYNDKARKDNTLA